jgi:hypothetical protein
MVSAGKKYTCQTCDGPGFYQRPAPGDWTGRGEFLHTGDADHPFVVKPQCPECDSFDYVFDQTDPWADITRCGACGHTDRRSLGD